MTVKCVYSPLGGELEEWERWEFVGQVQIWEVLTIWDVQGAEAQTEDRREPPRCLAM